MENHYKCPHCNAEIGYSSEHVGMLTSCPSCDGRVTLPGAPDPDMPQHGQPRPPPAPVAPAVTSVAADPADRQPVSDLPERMKANRVVAGRTCDGCGCEIDLGDDVHNCQSCGASTHVVCYDRSGSCLNSTCPECRLSTPAVAATPAADETPCRFCGEQIKKGARLCRFCGEYQDEDERALRKKVQEDADDDSTLTSGEIAFSIFCGGLACILGLIWMCQGKKKGGKMILIAFATNFIVQMIAAIVQSL